MMPDKISYGDVKLAVIPASRTVTTKFSIQSLVVEWTEPHKQNR